MQNEEIDKIRDRIVADPNTSQDMGRLIKIMSFQIEHLLEQNQSMNKRVTSMDECLYSTIEEMEEFKEVLRRQFWNSPNLTNEVEGSIDYQHDQGLTNRNVDMRNPSLEEGDTVQIVFQNPELQWLYINLVALCQRISPDVQEADVYEFIAPFL